MVINANYNINFGGSLISQKYVPLENVNFGDSTKEECINLFKDRYNFLLFNLDFCKGPLRLYAKWPENIEKSLAPIVIISSNRGKWIADILDNAKEKEKIQKFTGYNDETTFQIYLNPSDLSPMPWYAPLRSKRLLFIIVHMNEYVYYMKKIGSFENVIVIGYEYSTFHHNGGLVGFGASRFAAIQAMIKLGYHRAWAVDDDVININGFHNTLKEFEDEVEINESIWGIGFGAATKKMNDFGSVRYQKTEIHYESPVESILQQVVLWNLDLLRDNNINFSPLFITSNEDASLSCFLKQVSQNISYKIVSSCTIIKYEPSYDTETENYGSRYVNEKRKKICNLFKDIEADLKIKYYKNNSLTTKKLSDFIKSEVIPNCQNKNADALSTQMLAAEHIMREIIKQTSWYPPTVFNPYEINPGERPPVEMLHTS